jgi:hypothetical protein
MGNMFFGKKGEKLSEEKPKEKTSEQPQPKPKPKPIQFHCGYCGRDGRTEEFCFKRKWANKDRYHPFNGVAVPHMKFSGKRPLCVRF